MARWGRPSVHDEYFVVVDYGDGRGRWEGGEEEVAVMSRWLVAVCGE